MSGEARPPLRGMEGARMAEINGTCSKCLSTDIWLAWHKSRYSCGFSSKVRTDGEHLHYGCRNCRFEWTGPTADMQRKAEAEAGRG